MITAIVYYVGKQVNGTSVILMMRES